MSTLVTVLILLAAIIMIAAIFFQPAKGDGFVGGGAGQTAVGASGGTSFLFKLTLWCAFVIMGGSLYLSYANLQELGTSAVDGDVAGVVEPQGPANASPVTEQSAEPDVSANPPKAPTEAPQSMSPAPAKK